MQTTCIARWADTPRFHAKPQIICNCVYIVNTFLKALANKCNLVANLVGILPNFTALAIVVN
jgi:lipopolysaccharide export LptBFGC system permease protein LptF